jgi:sulfotransferase
MNLFFNTSMPRSGSELLQVILHQNPSVYASSTSPLLEYQFAARQNFSLPEVQSQPLELMETAFLSMCRSMAEGYYSAITDRPYIIDKNRGWSHYYEWVSLWNPNPKMICMVRDLRDVFSSFERIYRNNRHLPVGPDDPVNIQNMTLYQRLNHWQNTQPIGLALQRTADLFQKGIHEKILFVRYEDLCNSPSETMKTVYRYLGLEEFSHNFSNIEKMVQENDKLFGPYGSHKIKSFLSQNKSTWKETIGLEAGEMIVQQNKWFFNNFEYEV